MPIFDRGCIAIGSVVLAVTIHTFYSSKLTDILWAVDHVEPGNLAAVKAMEVAILVVATG